MITRRFLSLASDYLRKSVRSEASEGNQYDDLIPSLRSWCAWTTFGGLRCDAGYWTAELPLESELGEKSVNDGGTWGQPFGYDEIAHIIIPRNFNQEGYDDKQRFYIWNYVQDIDGLSKLLTTSGIDHRLAELVLEIKLY